MRKTVMLLLILSLSISGKAQQAVPRYNIHLTTMDGNTLKGLLMEVNDSSITIYPGKRKDWKSNLPPVHLKYTQIRQIKLKKRSGTVKGLLIGSLIGAAATVTFLMPGAKCGPNASGIGSLALFTGSTVAGGIWGGKASWGAIINGDMSIFKTFKTRYDAKRKK